MQKQQSVIDKFGRDKLNINQRQADNQQFMLTRMMIALSGNDEQLQLAKDNYCNSFKRRLHLNDTEEDKQRVSKLSNIMNLPPKPIWLTV